MKAFSIALEAALWFLAVAVCVAGVVLVGALFGAFFGGIAWAFRAVSGI